MAYLTALKIFITFSRILAIANEIAITATSTTADTKLNTTPATIAAIATAISKLAAAALMRKAALLKAAIALSTAGVTF